MVIKMVRFDKVKRAVYPVANTVIRILLLLITVGLCLQSLFSTSFIGRITTETGRRQERTLNIADQPWKHLLVFLLFTALGAACYRGYHMLRERVGNRQADWRYNGKESSGENSSNRQRYGRFMWILSAFVLLSGTAWILITQLAPGSDPAKVYSIAMQWRRGNFSSYAEGGYLFRYPFQAGIILFYYLLSFVLGIDNYVGLQIVNVLALVAVYVLLVKLSALFWKKDRKLPMIVYIVLILWVPLAFYVTYLYGILPGMALSLGAVYYMTKYIDTRKYRYIVPACLCMGAATVIKMNCLIYMVAIACFLLYDALDIVLSDRKEAGRRWVVSLAAIALMGVSVAGCNLATERYVEHLSGYKAGSGEEMISWVVMGLQETPLGPGGYSGYIGDVFIQYEYDAEKIREASLRDIKKILTRMSDNLWEDGIPFFARKNAFQWNDPTFIGMDRTKGRTSAIDMPDFAVSVIEGRGSVLLSVLLNYAQTLLLFGVLLYLWFSRRSRNLYELMGAVVFLGGYLFHFLWESSASYTIPYFVVLIPYAVKGLADWICYVAQLPSAVRTCRGIKKRTWELLVRHRLMAAGILLMMLLFAVFARSNLFDRTIALDDGEEALAQFYQEDQASAEKRARAAELQNGYYYLSPYLDRGVSVMEKNGEVTTVSVTENMTGSSGVTMSNSQDGQAILPVPAVKDVARKILLNQEKAGGSAPSGFTIRFRSNEQVLAAAVEEDAAMLTIYMDDGMNMFYQPEENVSCRWKFRRAEQEGYYLMIEDMALTYRAGALTLEEWTESEEQIWVLWQ